ncbi:hypothetical protein SAMN06297129_2593 [Pseudooceanicola antarcticus]|uniref:Uncharacterized protein n=1 Tax=Pseudooceanicola antarcticus TaxID=1247613 RepID=A0A285J049_9RHOB|nr:hypothetical protein [Pseudooceanicola antarcticus]SNY53690.1 hypothetical protein SAMN06297129_2593 [Pseudooceanicola antarcticus]
MRFLMPYLAGGAVAAFLAAAGLAWLLSAKVDRLQARAQTLDTMLTGCNGRVADLHLDKERDHAVDSIPDSDLGRSVPDRWLLPAE